MSKKELHDWTEDVEEYLRLPVGESTFEIMQDARTVEADYGLRLEIPTNLGIWRINTNSPLARELKKVKKSIGTIQHVTLTVVRTGEGQDTRYSIKNMVLPSQRKHEPPPKNQQMLNLEDLTEDQKRQLQQILKPDASPAVTS